MLNADLFLGIPLTSKLKEGSWYVPVSYNEKEGRAILNQIRTLDRKRLIKRIGALNEEHFKRIRQAFSKFYDTEEKELTVTPDAQEPYTPPEGGAGGKSQR